MAGAIFAAGLGPRVAGAQRSGTTALPRVGVQGNRFVTSDGTPMVFRGFSFSDPDRLARLGHWGPGLFQEARLRWNANVVRLPIHPQAWRQRGEESYLRLLDDGIRWAEEVGIFVIIDWHSIGNLHTELFQAPMYNTTKLETLRFWKSIATRYGNRSAVAFYELFNEPTDYNGTLGRADWAEHKVLMEELISTIRSLGATGIPLVAGFDWAYDLRAAGTRPIEAPGVAYVTHPYPMKRRPPWEEQWQADWGFMAARYPVFATELGYMSGDEPGAHVPVIAGEEYGTAIVSFFEARGISWAAWVFDPGWYPPLIRNWTYAPTRQGRFFLLKLRALNHAPPVGHQ